MGGTLHGVVTGLFKTYFQSCSIITTNTEIASVKFIYEARFDGAVTGRPTIGSI
jgi:hypothetical protein